jgi:hypothetical protein
MENAQLLKQHGFSDYLACKKFYLCLPIGLVCLFITLLFCGEYASRYLIFSGYYPIVNILIGVWYLLIFVGAYATIGLYMGLILIGLGQIAENTCKQDEVAEEADEKKPLYTPAPQTSSTWICPHCSTTNKSSVQYCIECDTAKPQTGRPQTSNTWTCKHCNTMNSNNSSQCKRCGKYKG